MTKRSDDIPVEVWNGDRKISIYRDVVLQVWGANMKNEMLERPRSLEAVQEAFDWLYAKAPERPAKLIKLKDVLELVPIGRSSIYEMMGDGKFPAAVRIGDKAVAWFESEIVAWQKSLPRAVITTTRTTGWRSDDNGPEIKQ